MHDFVKIKTQIFFCGGGVDQSRLPVIMRWVSCLYVHLTLSFLPFAEFAGDLFMISRSLRK